MGEKYIPVVIVITLQRIITLQRKTCVDSYIAPGNSLSYESLPPSCFRKITAVPGTLKCPEFLAMAPLRLELKRQYPGFNIVQYNIIIDVLGGYSKDLKKSVRELVGSERSTAVLGRMQKFVVSSSLKIARSLKIMG